VNDYGGRLGPMAAVKAGGAYSEDLPEGGRGSHKGEVQGERQGARGISQ
jgi:hypothetical protein